MFAGARLSGSVRVNGSLYTSGTVDATGADIHVVPADRSFRHGAVIGDISSLQAAAGYTIEVTSSQAVGSYTLADGALNFDTALDLEIDGNNFGALSVGSTMACGGKNYTLNRVASRLKLEIALA